MTEEEEPDLQVLSPERPASPRIKISLLKILCRALCLGSRQLDNLGTIVTVIERILNCKWKVLDIEGSDESDKSIEPSG